MVEMEVEGVRLEVPANAPVLMLREVGGERRGLPIYIGGPEASAIHFALEGIVSERPLTHDLLVNVIGDMGGELTEIVITEEREHTFFAELHIDGPAGKLVVSCRPSDAVALSVRVGAPIFATTELMDSAGVEIVTQPADEEEILDDFRQFIDSINPEDFQS
ncbi:MAG: bifunctional nuclease family protein [Ilumatobacteraceae bacterium]